MDEPRVIEGLTLTVARNGLVIDQMERLLEQAKTRIDELQAERDKLQKMVPSDNGEVPEEAMSGA
jgi:hypothetical protein